MTSSTPAAGIRYELARELWADAVRLAKYELRWRLGCAALAVCAIALALLADRGLFREAIFSAAAVLAWAVRGLMAWLRLRRLDPVEALHITGPE